MSFSTMSIVVFVAVLCTLAQLSFAYPIEEEQGFQSPESNLTAHPTEKEQGFQSPESNLTAHQTEKEQGFQSPESNLTAHPTEKEQSFQSLEFNVTAHSTEEEQSFQSAGSNSIGTNDDILTLQVLISLLQDLPENAYVDIQESLQRIISKIPSDDGVKSILRNELCVINIYENFKKSGKTLKDISNTEAADVKNMLLKEFQRTTDKMDEAIYALKRKLSQEHLAEVSQNTKMSADTSTTSINKFLTENSTVQLQETAADGVENSFVGMNLERTSDSS